MPESESKSTPPAVEWAQRKNLVFLTIQLEDCKKPEIKIDADKVYFRGVGGTEKKEHEVTIELCQEIVPEDSKSLPRDRNIEIMLKKKDEQFWPHLLKEKKKVHWLKIDFNKWKDEDDTDDEEQMPGGGGNDLQEMMSRMGGLGGAGMGGMGGMGGLGGMGGMGGMGGFGGMGDFGAGGGGKPDLNDLSDEEDDEELPDLE